MQNAECEWLGRFRHYECIMSAFGAGSAGSWMVPDWDTVYLAC
jgi:hypothetical protein